MQFGIIFIEIAQSGYGALRLLYFVYEQQGFARHYRHVVNGAELAAQFLHIQIFAE